MARKRSGVSVIPSDLLDIRVGTAQVPIYGASSVTENAEASTTTPRGTFDGVHNAVSPGGAGTVTIEIASLVEGEDWIDVCEEGRSNNIPVPFNIYSRGAYLFPTGGTIPTTNNALATNAATIEWKTSAMNQEPTPDFTPTGRYRTATIKPKTSGLDLDEDLYHAGHAIWLAASTTPFQVSETTPIHTIQVLLPSGGTDSSTKLGLLLSDATAQDAIGFAIVRPCLHWSFSANITQLTILPSFSAEDGAIANGTLEISPITRIGRPSLSRDKNFYA